MRISHLAAALLSTLVPAAAFGQSKSHGDEHPWYMTFGVGALSVAEMTENPGGAVDFDLGQSVSLGIGRHLGGSEHLRFGAEFEGLFTDAKIKDEDLLKIPSGVGRDSSSLSWLLNGVLDWRIGPQFSLMGVAGIGYASSIRMDFYDSGNLSQADTSALAWQFKIGALYNLGGRYDFLIDYRYYQTEDVTIDNLITGESFAVTNQDNVFELGVRWGL